MQILIDCNDGKRPSLNAVTVIKLLIKLHTVTPLFLFYNVIDTFVEGEILA